MKHFIQIALPTGSVYEIPIAAVVSHRAACMRELHKDEFPTLEASVEDSMELFKDDLGQARDWALNNMNWAGELEHVARFIRHNAPAIDLQEGEWTYHERRAMSGELDGLSIMRAPVEFIATSMIESNQLCNVTVLNGADGTPFGAVAVFVGSHEVINAYVNAMRITGDMITGQTTPEVDAVKI